MFVAACFGKIANMAVRGLSKTGYLQNNRLKS